MAKLSYTNIFDAVTDDPGEAADLEFRSDMMVLLRRLFEARNWDQADVMSALEISQPRVSELVTGKINKISSDKLITYLAKLGYILKPTYRQNRKQPIRCDVEERDPA
jgi:predicted XRE-type DNA-binding protein